MFDTNYHHAIIWWLNDCAPQGLFATDEEFIIRGWNCWLERQSPWLARDVMGRPLFEVLPELVESQMDRFYRDALIGHSHEVVTFDAHLKKEHAARIEPLVQDGLIVGTITQLEDISARLALEAASRAKDRFLARLAHDMRVPLSTMLGWISLMKSSRLNDRMFHRAVKSLERSALVQVQLIDDLLDISSIASEKLRLRPETIDLVPLVRMSVEAFRPMAENKRIQLSEAIPEQEAIVLVDIIRMEQIISNLLSNALKFTPGGGSVRIQLRRSESRVELTVQDNGIGISPEALPHIFDPFWQADEDSKKGLGLGLSIVKYLVQQQGGSIRAESPGPLRGSSLIVELPIAASSSETGDQRDAA
jgi:signal transduction histidine kinase